MRENSDIYLSDSGDDGDGDGDGDDDDNASRQDCSDGYHDRNLSSDISEDGSAPDSQGNLRTLDVLQGSEEQAKNAISSEPNPCENKRTRTYGLHDDLFSPSPLRGIFFSSSKRDRMSKTLFYYI